MNTDMKMRKKSTHGEENQTRKKMKQFPVLNWKPYPLWLLSFLILSSLNSRYVTMKDNNHLWLVLCGFFIAAYLSCFKLAVLARLERKDDLVEQDIQKNEERQRKAT
jgi:hypothetical protein